MDGPFRMRAKRCVAAVLFIAVTACTTAVSKSLSTTAPPTPTAPPPTTEAPVGWPKPPTTARPATVVHVTDGDTVVLTRVDVGVIHRATGGRKTRLIGVDTPEVYGGAECFGKAASAFTKDQLMGKQVLVDFDVRTTDRYGRALVYLWTRDGVLFNGRLASEGYAQQMTVPPNVRYTDLFFRLVREAREANRGLWAGC